MVCSKDYGYKSSCVSVLIQMMNIWNAKMFRHSHPNDMSKRDKYSSFEEKITKPRAKPVVLYWKYSILSKVSLKATCDARWGPKDIFLAKNISLTMYFDFFFFFLFSPEKNSLLKQFHFQAFFFSLAWIMGGKIPYWTWLTKSHISRKAGDQYSSNSNCWREHEVERTLSKSYCSGAGLVSSVERNLVSVVLKIQNIES